MPMHKKLMLAEIAKNKALSPTQIVAERLHAENLLEAGFDTAAFLHLWIVTEVAAKELMSIYKYTKDTSAALEKLEPKLKHVLIKNFNNSSEKPTNEQASKLTIQALPALTETLCDVFKKSYTSDFIRLDVTKIMSAIDVLALPVDKVILKYLLSTEIKERPDGCGIKDKTTVRARRNKLVHSNRQIDDAILVQLLPIFDYFFDFLSKIHQLAETSTQPNFNQEVA